MKKYHTGRSDQTTDSNSLTGIVNLLENDPEHQLPEGSEGPCRKVSEHIYQCLSDSHCRHKFPYESIRLCSWPKADTPERTLQNLPCSCTDNTKE